MGGRGDHAWLGANQRLVRYIARIQRAQPSSLETFVARQVRRLAAEPGSRDLKNPLEVTPLAIAEGRDHYADHCATCHANNGSGKT